MSKRRREPEVEPIPFTTEKDLRRIVQRRKVRVGIDLLGAVGALASIAGFWFSVSAVVASSWSQVATIALVLATLLFPLAVLVFYQSAALRSERVRWLQKADRALVYSILARTTGITRDDYKRTLVLRPNGSAAADFSYVIRAVTQRVDFVEHKTVLDTPVDVNAADAITLPSLYVKRRKVRPELRATYAGKELIQQLHFVPPIRQGEYDVVEGKGMTFPVGTFALLRSQLPPDRDFDYSAVEPTYPSNHLSCQLRFPAGFAPSAAPEFDVWIGGGRSRHEDEFARIRDEDGFDYTGDSGAEATATLNVRYPVPGLKYVIKWTPVAQQVM